MSARDCIVWAYSEIMNCRSSKITDHTLVLVPWGGKTVWRVKKCVFEGGYWVTQSLLYFHWDVGMIYPGNELEDLCDTWKGALPIEVTSLSSSNYEFLTRGRRYVCKINDWRWYIFLVKTPVEIEDKRSYESCMGSNGIEKFRGEFCLNTVLIINTLLSLRMLPNLCYYFCRLRKLAFIEGRGSVDHWLTCSNFTQIVWTQSSL